MFPVLNDIRSLLSPTQKDKLDGELGIAIPNQHCRRFLYLRYLDRSLVHRLDHTQQASTANRWYTCIILSHGCRLKPLLNTSTYHTRVASDVCCKHLQIFNILTKQLKIKMQGQGNYDLFDLTIEEQ